jgi:cysteine desulfurase
VLHAFEYLEKREGFRVSWLPVDATGRIDPERLRSEISAETTLVSIMSANNETGTLQPVGEISAICRERGVLFHSDAIQSFGKEPLSTAHFDAFSLAAHKFSGPKGAGLLYLRSGLAIERLQFGGSHENERRPGTENVAAIVGMAAAAELAVASLGEEQARQAHLRDELWRGLQAACPAAVLNGHLEHRLPNTLNVSFPGLDAESLLINLDLAGICASSGSACMVGFDHAVARPACDGRRAGAGSRDSPFLSWKRDDVRGDHGGCRAAPRNPEPDCSAWWAEVGNAIQRFKVPRIDVIAAGNNWQKC